MMINVKTTTEVLFFVHYYRHNSEHQLASQMTHHDMACYVKVLPLLWRHNGRGSVSNHQPHYCLLNCLFRRRSKHQSSASLAFVRGIHRGPVNSPHKWPVTWKMFPFDDVIMSIRYYSTMFQLGCHQCSIVYKTTAYMTNASMLSTSYQGPVYNHINIRGTRPQG